MTIHTITSAHTTPLYSKNAARKREATSFTILEVVAPVPKNSSTIYEDLSKKYDVRSATFEEINKISLGLYRAGEISLEEHAILTFDFGRATNDIKQQAGMQVSDDFSMYKTSANHIGQRDWIAEIDARASSHFKYGNIIGYQINSKLLAILQKLDTQ